MSNQSTNDPIKNYSFSTEEMEFSRLKRDRVFEIIEMLYKDGNPGFPTMANGKVKTSGGRKISAIWNDVGECIVGGIRVKPFDLIRPTRKEIEKAKSAKQALRTALMFIIILAIL